MMIKINFAAALSMLSPDCSLVELEEPSPIEMSTGGVGLYFTIAFVGTTAHLVHNSKKEDFTYFTYFN